MLQTINSVRFRLLLILVVLVVSITLLVISGLVNTRQQNITIATLDELYYQEATVYQLSVLADQWAEIETGEDRDAIAGEIARLRADFDAVQDALRVGDPARNIQLTDDRQTLIWIGTVEGAWSVYNRMFDQMFAGDSPEAQNIAGRAISDQSGRVGANLERITEIFEAEIERRQQLTGSLLIVGTVAIFALVLVGIVTVLQIISEMNRLRDAVARFGNGDHTTRAMPSVLTEIEQIGTVFNQMADTVVAKEKVQADINAELEVRVRERTAELERAKALALESVRLKSEFISTMSHELRTPLNAIIGFTGIMLEGMGGEVDDEGRTMLTRIDENSQRLLGLINEVLDLARIEAGRMEIVLAPVSPAALAEGWYEQTRVLAEQKGLAFSYIVDPALPDLLMADGDRLTQVAANLLSNAFKFTETGSVTLTMRRHPDPAEGESWQVLVTDTGIGIPPHAVHFIFDEFRQLDGSYKRVYGGSGLGLAIVRNLCRLMKGKVGVESELGKGSTFTVTLPLVRVEAPVAV